MLDYQNYDIIINIFSFLISNFEYEACVWSHIFENSKHSQLKVFNVNLNWLNSKEIQDIWRKKLLLYYILYIIYLLEVYICLLFNRPHHKSITIILLWSNCPHILCFLMINRHMISIWILVRKDLWKKLFWIWSFIKYFIPITYRLNSDFLDSELSFLKNILSLILSFSLWI